MTPAAKSSQQPVTPAPRFSRVDFLDWAVLMAIVVLMAVMTWSAGRRRGVELMPWPDGLEYAASAVNLASGRGPVLHFGGYTYPSRYTAGYPLILEIFYRILGREVPQLPVATWMLGMLSVIYIYTLTRPRFPRAPAVRTTAAIAALLLTLSPVFITYSSLVMSDVPTLFVTISAAFMLLAGATDALSNRQRFFAWSLFGLLAGFSTIMRPTNVTIFAGLALCLVMLPPRDRAPSTLLKSAIAIAIGFAIPVGWQLHQNAIHLGSPFASGYAWWVPEVYAAGGKTFSAAYLFGPTMPRNPHGNVPIYAMTLVGLDGLLGDRGDTRYFLYPFAAAVFAIIGFLTILRSPERPAARRILWFGLGYLAALTGLYCFYLFTDIAFILPAAFVLFIAAGAGASIANQWTRNIFRSQNRTPTQLAAAGCVIVLDFLLIISLVTELDVRLSAPPASSIMVPTLQSADATLPTKAIVVSNISLQFLELYMERNRDFVGLDSLDPGERFTDYHLHRLYEKKASGWPGPVPPVIFNGPEMSPEADTLISAKTPIFLLLATPESEQYAGELKRELDQLQTKFTLEPQTQNQAAQLYRLTPK